LRRIKVAQVAVNLSTTFHQNILINGADAVRLPP